MALTRIISEIIQDNTIDNSDISASFGSSISGSLGANASTIRTLSSTTVSGSKDAASISGSLGANAGVIRTLSATTVSGSRDAASISGSLGANASTIRTLSATTVSGSLGSNASTIRTLSATTVSGSRDAASISGSFGNQRVGTTDNVKFNNITGSNNISASGNLSITGNVDVDGTSNFAGNVTLQNDLTVTGRINAEEIHTTFISASITTTTGSNIFGDATTDSHQFTGSLDVSGSLRVSDGNLTVSDTLTATNIGAFTAAGAINFNSQAMTNVDINSGTINGITDLAVADGGTGASTAAGAAENLGLGITDNVVFSAISGSTGEFTSNITGSGDLGADGDLYIGGKITGSGLAVFNDNVGIGTTVMDALVNINSGAANAGLHVESTDSSANISLADNLGSAAVINIGGRLVFETGGTASTAASSGTESMTISGSLGSLGSVGIGSATPTARLDVNGGATINGNMIVGRGGEQKGRLTVQSRTGTASRKTNAIVAVPYNDTSESICMIGMDGQAGNNEMHIGSNTSDFMSPTFIDFFTATSVTSETNNRAMRITSGQQVGIGADSPATNAKLHVKGNGGGQAIAVFEDDTVNANVLISATDANRNSILNFGDAASTEIGQVDYDHNDNSMRFVVNASEAVRITSAGDVGIGTNSPDAGLDLRDTMKLQTNTVPASLIVGTNDTTDHTGEDTALCIDFRNLSTTNGVAGGLVGLDKDGLELSKILLVTDNHDANTSSIRMFTSTNASQRTQMVNINNDGVTVGGGASAQRALHVQGTTGMCLSDGDRDRAALLPISPDSANGGLAINIRSGSASHERVRINNQGTVMIGGTLPEDVGTGAGLVIQKKSGQNQMAFEILDDDSTADSNNVLMALRFDQDNNADGASFIEFQDSAGVIGTIKVNGAGNTSFNDSSDERLKENITDVDDGYLKLINDVRIRNFDWIGRPNSMKKVGVIAQELEKIIPNVVSKGGDDPNKQPYQVSYPTLVPYLIKAVQELTKRIEALENN